MKYLPYESLIFKSKLNENEIITKLEDIIEPRKIFRLNWQDSGKSKPYEGEIVENKFKMNRIIRYGNSFLPRISGLIHQDISGSTIKVKMRLHFAVLLFLFIWCGFVGFAFVMVLLSNMMEKSFNPAVLIVLGMLLFAYLLTMFGFKYESRKSIEDLNRYFEINK